MSKQTHSNADEMGRLADDGCSTMPIAADLANEEMGAARRRLDNAMRGGKALITQLRERTTDRVKAADRSFRDHPYEMIAIAAGAAVVLGFLLAQGGSRRRD